MTNTPIFMSRISGDEFVAAMNKLEAAAEGLTPTQFIIALIGLSLTLQYPDIEPEELQVGIKGASQWIAMYLDSIQEKDLPKELVN